MASDDSLRTNQPRDALHEGCPVRVKSRHATFDQGIAGFVDWELRDNDGDALDLSAVFPSGDESLSESADGPGSVEVRIALIDAQCPLATVAGECSDAALGRVRFQIPTEVADQAGVYRMQIGVRDVDGSLLVVDKGLLFIEPSLFVDSPAHRMQGPPTLKEIRSYIRDTGAENDLLRDVEFDDDELVTAIIAPIREWNEMPPRVAIHSTRSFPYREHWIKAILGHLCQMASAWYLRNKLQTTFGGTSQDDRNKNAEYTQLAEMYKAEWRKFVMRKKYELNIGRGFATLSGPYY